MTIILHDSWAYDGHHFTPSWDHGRTKCTLVTEASDIGYHRPNQIYDDAADVGIAIRSARSGRIVRYYLYDQDVNGEDVAGWRFKPIAEDARCIPGAARTEVLIIND